MCAVGSTALNYRHGLRRAFAVLSILWALAFLVGYPLYVSHYSYQRAIELEVLAQRRDDQGFRAWTRADTVAEIGQPYRELAAAYTVPNWCGYLVSVPLWALSWLLGPPAALFAFAKVVVWISAGFRRPSNSSGFSVTPSKALD